MLGPLPPKYFQYHTDKVMTPIPDLRAMTRHRHRETGTQLKSLHPEAPQRYRSLAYVRTLLRPRDLAS